MTTGEFPHQIQDAAAVPPAEPTDLLNKADFIGLAGVTGRTVLIARRSWSCLTKLYDYRNNADYWEGDPRHNPADYDYVTLVFQKSPSPESRQVQAAHEYRAKLGDLEVPSLVGFVDFVNTRTQQDGLPVTGLLGRTHGQAHLDFLNSVCDAARQRLFPINPSD